MILGISGSRGIDISIPEELLPQKIDKIITGGAIGIDKSARDYALDHGIPITEILPEYDLYGRKAPLIRNDIIINKSDMIYVFWDGKSKGSQYVINKCKELDKPCKVFLLTKDGFSPIEI